MHIAHIRPQLVCELNVTLSVTVVGILHLLYMVNTVLCRSSLGTIFRGSGSGSKTSVDQHCSHSWTLLLIVASWYMQIMVFSGIAI